MDGGWNVAKAKLRKPSFKKGEKVPHSKNFAISLVSYTTQKSCAARAQDQPWNDDANRIRQKTCKMYARWNIYHGVVERTAWVSPSRGRR